VKKKAWNGKEINDAGGLSLATGPVRGTLGRTGLPHLRLVSVAEKTIRGSECPVLPISVSSTRPTI
jgi:hypothetical protein